MDNISREREQLVMELAASQHKLAAHDAAALETQRFARIRDDIAVTVEAIKNERAKMALHYSEIAKLELNILHHLAVKTELERSLPAISTVSASAPAPATLNPLLSRTTWCQPRDDGGYSAPSLSAPRGNMVIENAPSCPSDSDNDSPNKPKKPNPKKKNANKGPVSINKRRVYDLEYKDILNEKEMDPCMMCVHCGLRHRLINEDDTAKSPAEIKKNFSGHRCTDRKLMKPMRAILKRETSYLKKIVRVHGVPDRVIEKLHKYARLDESYPPQTNPRTASTHIVAPSSVDDGRVTDTEDEDEPFYSPAPAPVHAPAQIAPARACLPSPAPERRHVHMPARPPAAVPDIPTPVHDIPVTAASELAAVPDIPTPVHDIPVTAASELAAVPAIPVSRGRDTKPTKRAAVIDDAPNFAPSHQGQVHPRR